MSEFSLYVPLITETVKLSLIFLSSAVIEIVSTIALFDSLISFVLLVKVGVLFSPASFIVISWVSLTPAESVTVIVYTAIICSPAPRKSIFAWEIAYSQFITPLFVFSLSAVILKAFFIFASWGAVKVNAVVVSLLKAVIDLNACVAVGLFEKSTSLKFTLPVSASFSGFPDSISPLIFASVGA